MNKLTKLLSVFIIAGAVGTGIAGVAGCSDKKPDKKPEGVHHTEQHELKYEDNGNGTHKISCKIPGCDYEVTNPACEDHKNNDTLATGEDGKCDLCGATMPNGGGEDDDQYDLVTTSVDFREALDAVSPGTTEDFALAEDYTYKGKITFAGPGKARFEYGNKAYNTQGASGTVTIVLKGETNSIKIVGTSASGKFTGATLTCGSETIATTGDSFGTIQQDNLPKGTYVLTTNGGAGRITEITIVEKLAKSEATGISLKALDVDYLKGQDLITSNLEVKLHYKNGRADTLSGSQYEITQESLNGIDKNTAGKYTVTVKYKENEAFTASYDVYYYTIDSIELHTIGLTGDGKTQLTAQQAVKTGGEVSYANVTVKGTGTIGEGANARTHTFNLPTAALNIENVSTATEGEKDVNVSVNTEYTTNGASLTESYKVAVKNAITATNNKVELTVGETGDFKTLTQAVQFIKLCNIDDTVNKVIKLQAGTYTEKVWLDIPNVTLIGLGENIDDTELTYSLVEGDKDAITNKVWGLVCATLHVTGKNFKAYNLAIRNDFDYINNASKYSGSQSSQGVALTLDADGAVIYNCHLYGNQDTLFMKSGRSYYYKTQIDGNVDFIFGETSGLAYFEECKIVAINRTAVNLETGKGNEQNGYVTAAKHDKDAKKPDYGYVFYKCEMTDDGKVKDGAMSLGRSWGACATVAYIECSFSKAYSVKSSDDSGKDHRWADWSNGTKAENADFKEYGSTGEGALTEKPEGFKGGNIIDKATADLHTKENLFGAANGAKVGYDAAFDYATAYSNLRKLAGLEEGEIVEDTVVDYKFSKFYASGDAANTYHATEAAGEEMFGGAATIIGSWGHELNQSKDQAKFAKGTVIKFNIAGKVSVTTYGDVNSNDNYGVSDNVDVNYINGKAIITIVATDTYPINNGCYITLIQLDKSLTNEAHVHKYGEWTVTKDEEAETYTATRTCTDCELETAASQSVSLPALSTTDYAIAASQTSGKSIYTYTHETYGDITFEADAIGHVHSYSGWTYNKDTGKITGTCSGGDDCDETTIDITVPELTDSAYTITNNTATLEAAGTGTYTIKIDDVTYSFTADTPQFVLTTISAAKDYNFGKMSSPAEIKKSNDGHATMIEELLVENGTFASNGGQWYAIAKNTTIKFKLAAGYKVVVTIYNDSGFSYTIGEGGAATAATVKASGGESGNPCFEIPSKATENVITITATGSGYIGAIRIIADE